MELIKSSEIVFTVILQDINAEVSQKKNLMFAAVNFGKGRFYVFYKLDGISVRMPVYTTTNNILLFTVFNLCP